MNNSNFSADTRNYLLNRILPKLISIISVPILLRLINPTFWGEVALLVGLQSLVISLISQGKIGAMERYFTKMTRKYAKFYALRYLYISVAIFLLVLIILEVGFRLKYFNFFGKDLPITYKLLVYLLLSFLKKI